MTTKAKRFWISQLVRLQPELLVITYLASSLGLNSMTTITKQLKTGF
jgi:hypothetical protein